MDINKEDDCEIKFFDDELNEITGGAKIAKQPGIAICYYGIVPEFPKDPKIIMPIKPGDKMEDIEKLLKDGKAKREKLKEEKVRSKNLSMDNTLPPQQ